MIRHGTVWQRLNKSPFVVTPLTTGCSSLDESISGGLHESICYEINGNEVTGKTTWCLERATSLRDTSYVIVFRTNNAPVQRICGGDITIDDTLELPLDGPGIRIVSVFSATAMLGGLFRLYDKLIERTNKLSTLVTIDALTPILGSIDEEDFENTIDDFSAAFFQLKTLGCRILVVTNGDKVEMSEPVVSALTRFVDATLVFTWDCGPPQDDTPLRGPNIQVKQARHGTGIPSLEFTLAYDTNGGPVVDTRT